jgi:hypothetical protein
MLLGLSELKFDYFSWVLDWFACLVWLDLV